MPAKYIIVTATDDGYLPLALDLVTSLRHAPAAVAFDIGILDLGLSETSKQKLTPYGVIFKTPGVDIEYPGRTAWEQKAPFYRCLTARPFLCDYFAGYAAYMWMDADAWLQTPDLLNEILPAASADDALYIAPELDRDYPVFFKNISVPMLHAGWYKAHFPTAMAQEMMFRPMLNCGVFAMSPRAVAWEAWAKLYAETLVKISELGFEHFMVDQLCLNIAAYLGPLPLRLMPAEYNWLTMYCMPLFDEERNNYVRPTVPRTLLSVVHIAGKNKSQKTDILTTTGKIIHRRLTYSSLFADNEESATSSAPRFIGDRL